MNGVSFTLSLPFTSAREGNQITSTVTLVYHGNKVSEPVKSHRKTKKVIARSFLSLFLF